MNEPAGFWDRLCASVAEDVGKEVSFVYAPARTEESTPPTLPYGFLYPVVETNKETSMEDPHNSSDIVIVVVAVGQDATQTRWMSNKMYHAFVDKDLGGHYRVDLGPASDNIEWRICDQRGAILPAGPILFEERDNYRLRRGE